MRKILTALCIVGAFALMADVASARPRISMGSSKPAVAKSTAARPDAPSVRPQQRTQQQQQQHPQAAPRGWVVAVPRAPRQPAQGQNAFDHDAAPAGELASSAGANDIGAAPSSPLPARAMPAAQAAAKPSPEPQAAAKPDAAPKPQAAAKPADVVPPAPTQKRIAAAPQPRDYAICYWNRTGQCMP